MVGTSDKAILFFGIRLWMIIRFGAIDGQRHKRRIYVNLKRLLKRRAVVSFVIISNAIIIISIKSQLSINLRINKEIESTSHNKRILINDGYIYF